MSVPHVSIVVPTYREALNIPLLVPRVAQACQQAGLTCEIVIVDDNSPDDTRQVCAALAEQYPVRLEVRTTERGLSGAVVHGLRQARGEICVVMDADLSHPPEKVPELVAALADPQVDFAIGSRYVPGARTDESWGLFRWLNSAVATWLARPFTSARDPMAGFFALRRTQFEAADRLDPVGYKIGLELIVKCHCRTICEIPIYFADRIHGESKLSLKEQLNYLRHLKRLAEYKYGDAAYLVQFVLVGGTGMVVDLTLFSLLLGWAGLHLARALAIGAAMTWNFVLNRRLTFAYARSGSAVKQYVLFCVSCSLGAVINWGVSITAVRTMAVCGRYPLLAAFFGIVAGTLFNYVLSRRVVFAPQSPVSAEGPVRAGLKELPPSSAMAHTPAVR